MTPALSGMRRVWFQCSIQLILYHSQSLSRGTSYLFPPLRELLKNSARSAPHVHSYARLEKAARYMCSLLHMCCAAHAQPDASESWLWKKRRDASFCRWRGVRALWFRFQWTRLDRTFWCLIGKCNSCCSKKLLQEVKNKLCSKTQVQPKVFTVIFERHTS